jgi:hypothetical protein
MLSTLCDATLSSSTAGILWFEKEKETIGMFKEIEKW